MLKLCIFVAFVALVRARPQNAPNGMAPPNQAQMQQLRALGKSCIVRKDLTSALYELITKPTTTIAEIHTKMAGILQQNFPEAWAFIQQIIEAHKKKHIEFLDCFGQKIAGDNNEELTKAVNNLRADLQSDTVTIDDRCNKMTEFVSKLSTELHPKLHDCVPKHDGPFGHPGGAGGGGFFMFGGAGGNGQGGMNGNNGGSAGGNGQGGISGPKKMPSCDDMMKRMTSEMEAQLKKYQCNEDGTFAAPTAGVARDAPAAEPAPAPEN